MNKRMVMLVTSLILIAFLGIFLTSCGSSGSANPAPTSGSTTSGSASDGQALMQARCSVCHSTDRITSAHKTAVQWKATVDRMINHGAQLNAQEQQTLVDYLAQNYK